MPHLATNHERVKDFRITLDRLGPKPRFRMHVPYDIPTDACFATLEASVRAGLYPARPDYTALPDQTAGSARVPSRLALDKVVLYGDDLEHGDGTQLYSSLD